MKKLLLFLMLCPLIASAQLTLPYSIKINNAKPLDYYYYESDGTPYDNTTEVLTAIPSAVRYQGMTVNVLGVEYWFGDGITDGDLKVKLSYWPLDGDITVFNSNITFSASPTTFIGSSIFFQGGAGNTRLIVTEQALTLREGSTGILFQATGIGTTTGLFKDGTFRFGNTTATSVSILTGATREVRVYGSSSSYASLQYNGIMFSGSQTFSIQPTGRLSLGGSSGGVSLNGSINLNNNLASSGYELLQVDTNGDVSLLKISSTASTGTDVAFDIPRTYGYAADATGNITFTATGLVEGMTQLMIHNDSSEPTFETGMVVISGTYQTGVDNYIMFMAIKSNLILVTISQEQ